MRMQQGKLGKVKLYDQSPLDVAMGFADIGIKKIHLIDMDGAMMGSPGNYHALQTISAYTDLHINFSGGINTDGDIGKAWEYGAASITAGSVAVLRKELFASWIISYGREKIALSADARVPEGANSHKIAIDGWQRDTDLDLFEHVEHFYSRSLKYVKISDIDRDGTLQGPNFELYQTLVRRFPDLHVSASGGVHSLDDIKRLEDIGVSSVILGKALYEGSITTEDLEGLVPQMG